MALLDDLYLVVSMQGTENKIRALRSAFWIFERNPDLSLAQQAEGIAFLIASCLRETEAKVRERYWMTIDRILRSRPYQVGARTDWATLTNALPQLASADVSMVLYLLRYATDERYLSLLEQYFGDVEQGRWAISSWVILAYTQRYTYDTQVLPFLQEAEKNIEKGFASARRLLQEKPAGAQDTREARKEYLRKKVWQHTAQAWARQQFAEAEKHIRQQVQVRNRTAFMQEYEEKKLRQNDPNYLPTRIQGMLARPSREEKFRAGVRNLNETFLYAYSLPIDEIAHSVKVLMDYIFSGEDPSVNREIWWGLATAFDERVYVGTYLDWDRFTAVLSHLGKEEQGPYFYGLRAALVCLGRAPDEHPLDVLKPYLDHPNDFVRQTAAEAIRNLIWHLAHYCAEVGSLIAESGNILILQEASTPSERWQVIKGRLEQLEHDARPYFHYYSI